MNSSGETPWINEQWHVSPYNFAPEVTGEMTLARDIIISDCTLRDGEQMPGVVFGLDDKVRLAQVLDEIGIPEIEVGMPSVSALEEQTITAIARLGLKATIRVVSMATKADIDRAVNCGARMSVVSLPAGYLQIEAKLKWPEERIIDTAINLTNYAHERGLQVVFSPMDTTRSHREFLERYLKAVVKDGHVDRVRITDTAGAATPLATKYLVRKVAEFTLRPVEIHTHDDFGLAAANIIAGLEAGASVASTTLNGIGERGGNAATEEIAAALRTLYNVDLGLKLEKLFQASRILQEISGIAMPPHKGVVGSNAFAQEAGSAVAGWLANPFTAEPYLPEVVGQTSKVILGKWTGKAAVAWKLQGLGISVTDEQAAEITRQVKEEAERTRQFVSEDSLARIAGRVKA
jgi:isopropylmalate/homocitrate/citramalate synthase